MNRFIAILVLLPALIMASPSLLRRDDEPCCGCDPGDGSSTIQVGFFRIGYSNVHC